MVSESTRDFLLGFIAGEGSFMIEVGDIQRRRWNVNISPKFTLLVHEEEILNKLQDNTGLGRVHVQESRSMWVISSIDECVKFCDIIDKSDSLFHHTNKYQQYEEWKKAVSMIEDGKHTTKDGAHELVNMSYSIGKPKQRKRSKRYYHNRIDEAGDYICGGKTSDGGECQRHVSEEDGTCQYH